MPVLLHQKWTRPGPPRQSSTPIGRACEFVKNGRVLPGEADAMPELTRITRDPAVMGGKPGIRGMRVTVGTVVGLVAAGRTRDEILREYP